MTGVGGVFLSKAGESLAGVESEPRIQAALEELRGIIGRHFPTATFTVTRGEDPTGIDPTPVVDVEDLDEVTDVFLDRLIELQVEEGLPGSASRPLARPKPCCRHRSNPPHLPPKKASLLRTIHTLHGRARRSLPKGTPRPSRRARHQSWLSG